MASTAARIVGIVKRFRNVVAVDQVTFDVAPGEFLTLLGPSGCGKTTTLRALAGLETLDDGAVYIGDQLVSSGPREAIHVPPEKREVSMVFQSYAIWPHMTVFENIEFPLRFRRSDLGKAERRRRVLAVMAMVGLEGLEDRMATRLSGGQQQRVALARAVVIEPQLLLLDEPLSNLDAKLRAHMRVELKRLQRQTGLATVYVTHDQAEAITLSDRVIVMNAGRIEQVGQPSDIYEQPRTEFVARFVGASNVFVGSVIDANPSNQMVYVAVGSTRLACLGDPRKVAAGAGQVVLMVRPEKIRVLPASDLAVLPPDGSSPANRLRGKVEVDTYCGDHREVTIATDDLFFTAFTRHTAPLAAGMDILLEFAPQDAMLLPA